MILPRLSMLIVSMLLCLSGAAQGADRVLRVLAWPGYADSDVVRMFEQAQQARVEVTLVDSDEAVYDRLAAGHGRLYDVVAANTVEIGRHLRAGRLRPIDPRHVPNLALQQARFRDLDAIGGISLDGQQYAVPFTYSSMGLIYDRRQVPTPPRTMAELWNPRYQGKVLAFNSAQHNFSFTALAMGIPQPFALSSGEMHAVTLRLVATRRNLLAYYNLPEEATELFLSHKVALMYANYGTQQLTQLRAAGADVGYAIPDEGALAWLDCWAVVRDTPQADLAEAWINFMLDPTVSQSLTQRQGLANTLAAGNAAAEPAHLVWLRPVEDVRQREELWGRIVSGDRLERFH